MHVYVWELLCVLCPNKYAVQFLLRLLFHIYSGYFFRCSCSFTPHTDFSVVAVSVATLLHFSRLFSSFSFHFQCNIRAAPLAGHIVARYAFWHLKETQEITTKQVRGLLLVGERATDRLGAYSMNLNAANF